MTAPDPIAASPRELLPVLEAFGLGTPCEVRPLGGTGTRKWDVATAGGRFVVRLRAAEFADRDATRFQHEVLQRLQRAGFPVPAPLTAHSGATWFAQGGNVYEVLSWIEGEPFVENDSAAVENLGILLARMHRLFTDDPPQMKTTGLREDHPDLMRPYLAGLRQLAHDDRQDRELTELTRQLDHVAAKLDAGLYASLPQSVIHGDVHRGNLRFRQSRVAAIYDFDYLHVQARARDLSDGLISFASRRGEPFDPDVIHSLVQPFVPDAARCQLLLRGYQSVTPLTEREWQALPWLIRSRWIQMRLRGARKLAEDQRLHFVLHRFFEVIDWLDREAAGFFLGLKRNLGGADSDVQ
jgi:Ser/Thr protein kinase RdoA (MazF antagonist)